MPARARRRIAAGTAALLVLALLATAPATAEPPLATPILDASGVQFQTGAEAGSWLLTVSGPNGYYVRRELSGRTLVFSPSGDNGALPADGSYIWELRASQRDGAPRGAVQSGHFTVQSGAILLPDASPERSAAGSAAPPPPSAPDFNGDFHIGGNLAFGFDVDGAEVFGLSNLLVEDENNRLLFTDTSSTLAFPTNDWQIIFNDSSNAGAEYLSIADVTGGTTPFRIDALAATDSLRIDQNGRVGIGTATPATKLHVVGDTTLDGDLSVLSSRSAKDGFAAVDPRAVLARLAELEVLEWSYRGHGAVRHLGPVAEDFHALFDLGADGRTIHPLDLAGVALVAVQGLRSELSRLAERDAERLERLAERERQIALLTEDRDELRQRLESLEGLVAELVGRDRASRAATAP